MEKYDLIIVGAGPAGIFTAVELLRRGSKKHILLVEKGKPVEKRHCPKAEIGHCVNCRPTCAITTGFSGAGAFSDGKLSLSYEVGGDLPSLIGEEFAQELIDYTDKIYLEFGADPHVEGIYTGEDIKEIRKNAIHAGLKLVDCPIRHLGTEKAQQLYLAIQNYLADNGVEMLFSTECENIILEDEECKGVLLRQGDGEPRAVYGDTVVIDFEGFDNGEAFEGGKGENHDLKLGSGSFVPGFEEQIVGMSAGEEKDINITFPENYHADLAGKAVVFHVKVNKVTETVVPAMDDEFAKDVSEFDTLDALKADIRAKAMERALSLIHI